MVSPDLLYDASISSGNNLFLKSSTSSFSFLEAQSICSSLETLLKNSGLLPGSKVVLIEADKVKTVLLTLALRNLGALALILSPKVTHEQSREIISDLNASAYIGSEIFSEIKCFTYEHLFMNAENYSVCQSVRSRFDEDENAMIFMTSGSQGKPKYAVLTRGNFYYSALGTNHAHQFTADCMWAANLSLSHIGGWMIIERALCAAGCVYFPEKNETGWLEKVSHLSAVPFQTDQLIEQGKTEELKNLKYLLIGGAPMSRSLFDRLKTLQIDFYTTWGMTETASQMTASIPSPSYGNAGSVLNYRELSISSESEILAGGKTIFKGYFKDGEISRPDIDGFFPTGDLGEIKDGCLFVTGRKDEMLISGGENIHPSEIENCARLFQGVDDACAVAVPDTKWSQRPWLYYTGDAQESDLKTFLVQKLSKFKVPDQIIKISADESSYKLKRSDLKKRALIEAEKT